jgi:hypothetical protein
MGTVSFRVFENRMLRRMFGSKRDEVTGEWRKLRKEKLNDLYFSTNFIRPIYLRRMRCVGNVARMGEACTGFWWGNVRERDHLGDQGVDGRIIYRWIFRKWDVVVWTGLSWLRIGQVTGTCECGNEPSGFIKCMEFLD